MDILDHNRRAWDAEVESGSAYTIPVSVAQIAAARRGKWQLFLTATRPIPRPWFPSLRDCEVLCLAGGGGQQGPILAAAGARVTVYDLSPRQLARDRFVAERDGLELVTVEGDMADLSAFPDGRFGLIVHPISNLFAPSVHPVWAEAHRVLRPGGILISAFMNPARYIFDLARADNEGVLEVKHSLPFSSTDLSEVARDRIFGADAPLEFSHTLEDQIGGQLRAGFVLTDFFEDTRPDDLIAKHLPAAFVTRAIKASHP